jgi:ParB family chromosome partitioning protein
VVENIQRHDLDPVKLHFHTKVDEIQLTQEQMSERVGKKRSTIANYLRLLKLDPIIQTGFVMVL